jgi:hypothetical protein
LKHNKLVNQNSTIAANISVGARAAERERDTRRAISFPDQTGPRDIFGRPECIKNNQEEFVKD